ncbi:MAG: prepilin-type N-terminal cleavage/methylation domain-containing protein [Candidatus Muirbacterium halophilum]|nr:prepilin-type N-terminal cleavage/methylation domain-containing protein [Candidatus Muirbacterium halophilum]MCK9475320.1 prepilin-type N-terminal cleavage/methylation domain-containing protein [Candidatus Muirbacterium halophilum]
MNKKAFTLIEVTVAIAVFAMLSVLISNIFFSGSRAYRKEIRNFTILDRGRFLFIKIRNDIRNANSILYPDDNGKESEKLVLLKHKFDFNKKPEDTPGFNEASIYFDNIKIEYSLEEHTDKDEKDLYRDLKKLIRKEYTAKISGDNVIYNLESEDIISHNIEKLIFLRKKLVAKIPGDKIEPEEGGIAPENVKIEVLFKSYRDEDYSLSLDQIKKYYSVRFSTYINSRGNFLGGSI